MRTIALCDGYGGFELGLKLAGAHTRTICRVERNAHAAATLIARMSEGNLDRAHLWDDITTFDGARWAGQADLITAGLPCQPFSQAGERRGVDDIRWIWTDAARIIAEVGPQYVFLENVPQFVRLGLPHVISDLAGLGYHAAWGCFPASAVGAPHKRNRIWLWAAMANTDGIEREPAVGEPDRFGVLPVTRRSCDVVANSESGDGMDSRRLCVDARRVGWGRAGICRETVGDTAGNGRDGRNVRGISRGGTPAGQVDGPPQPGGSTFAGVRLANSQGERFPAWRPECPTEASESAGCVNLVGAPGIGVWPPGRHDAGGWEDWLAAGGPEPAVRRSPDGATGRVVRPRGLGDQLHLLGNGLVPQAAAVAYLLLSDRLDTAVECLDKAGDR